MFCFFVFVFVFVFFCFLWCAAYTSYRYDMPIEEAAELARRSIYHAIFRDGASGGVGSGTLSLSLSLSLWTPHIHDHNMI